MLAKSLLAPLSILSLLAGASAQYRYGGLHARALDDFEDEVHLMARDNGYLFDEEEMFEIRDVIDNLDSINHLLGRSTSLKLGPEHLFKRTTDADCNPHQCQNDARCDLFGCGRCLGGICHGTERGRSGSTSSESSHGSSSSGSSSGSSRSRSSSRGRGGR